MLRPRQIRTHAVAEATSTRVTVSNLADTVIAANEERDWVDIQVVGTTSAVAVRLAATTQVLGATQGIELAAAHADGDIPTGTIPGGYRNVRGYLGAIALRALVAPVVVQVEAPGTEVIS